MSKAPLQSSTGSQHSLRPDDLISQVIPPYFTDNSGYRYDIEIDKDGSGPSDILSSAPSHFLTLTIGSNSLQDRALTCHRNQAGNIPQVPSFMGGISGIHLSIPFPFLPLKKARKGHCWFSANGIEVFFYNGKWCWKCARCRYSCYWFNWIAGVLW